MVIMKTFADDSGGDGAYVVAGYVSFVDVWDRFSCEWRDVLLENPSIKYFRNNEALGLKNQFANFQESDRNAKLAKLAGVIPIEQCWSVASYLKTSDFENLFAPNFDVGWNNPYYLCALNLVVRTAHLFDREALKIDFVFDEQGKVGRRFQDMYKWHTKFVSKAIPSPTRPNMSELFGKCSHENDRLFPPLQAADMNAAWVRRRNCLIQRWTDADPYLARIKCFDFEVKPSFLVQMVEYQRTHSKEIQAFLDDMR